MVSGLLDGRLTVWRRQAGGGFARSELAGVRVERREEASAGSVGMVPGGGAQGSGIVAYVPGVLELSPGDYVAQGAVALDAPPEGAKQVESVQGYTLRGFAHHTEVKAR